MIDTKKEHIAVTEANRLGIPVVAVVDTNCDPDVIDLRDPGQRRRDPLREPDVAVIIADAVIEGQQHRVAQGQRARAPRRGGRAPPSPSRSRSIPRRRARRPRSRSAPATRRRASSARRERSRRSAVAPTRRRSRHRRRRAGRGDPRRARGRRPRRDGREPRRRPEEASERQWLTSQPKDVAALRKMTGAGMMDCKKALEETDGDIETAKDWLREKGIAGAAKRAGRDADQGAIDVHRRRQRRRARRAQLRDRLRRQGRRLQARSSASSPSSWSSTATTTSAPSRSTAAPSTTSSSSSRSKLGENIELGRVRALRDATTACSTRTSTSRTSAARSACSSSSAASTRRREGPRGRARHRAAHRARRTPLVTRDDVPADDVEQERAMLEAQTREEGKPEQAWPKIVDGKLNGFFKDGVARRAVVRPRPKTTIGSSSSQSLGARCHGAPVRAGQDRRGVTLRIGARDRR